VVFILGMNGEQYGAASVNQAEGNVVIPHVPNSDDTNCFMNGCLYTYTERCVWCVCVCLSVIETHRKKTLFDTGIPHWHLSGACGSE
jgi:hypothetical protein